MDQVIGRDRCLRESDLPKLPYLNAICMEALRKHPSVPLTHRVTAEDCQVNGYDIPKGTWLAPNVWVVGRDLKYGKTQWNSCQISPWGNDFELIPFGSGRRICVRMMLCDGNHRVPIRDLVHAFDWKLPGGVGELAEYGRELWSDSPKGCTSFSYY